MPFFPEIDDKQTRRNARRILSGYKRWKRIASDLGNQRLTQELTFMPRNSSNTPSRPVERLAINRVDAEAELEAIEYAVSALYEPEYRFILINKYLKPYPKSNTEIADELGYERTRYTELLGYALIAFAEAYRGGEQLVESGKIACN